MIWEMTQLDMSTPQAVSHMIGYSVRWSIPFIYLVMAASAMPKLFPGDVTRWWGRNRKYFGLCFAAAMAWQAAFIFIISNNFRDYYFEEVYVLRDEIEGSVGYIFLVFMVLTSFQFGRKLISHAQWKVLHTLGIHFLWAYPFAVYWWNLYYYGDPRWFDYLLYWAGFFVFAARIAAWGQKRSKQHVDTTSMPNKILGSLTIAIALIMSASGGYWQDPLTTFMTQPAWSEALVLWLPFWPFEPFFPLAILAFGTWLFSYHPHELKKAILADTQI